MCVASDWERTEWGVKLITASSKEGNILILRGEIVIEPPERKSVSYELLSHLVAEALLLRSPEVDVSDAFSIMPLTQSE